MNTSLLKRDRGVALIIVLSFVVLAAAVVVAFISRAQTSQKIAAISTGGGQADTIARGAIDVIVDDLRDEIRRGSSTTSAPFMPNTEAARYPQRNFPLVAGTDGDPAPALLKISNEQAFHSQGSGVIRGSGALTTAESKNKRAVTADRWKKSRLIPANSTFAWATLGPQWIYVTEKGDIGVKEGTTTVLKDTDIGTLKKGPEKNASGALTAFRPAIGRFAYIVYDVGGLLDVNVAGNGLGAAIKGRKGRLHQASLSDLIGTDPAKDLIDWRNPVTGGTDLDTDDGLFDPERNFGHPLVKTVAQGGGTKVQQEQVYLSRQDLIADFETRGLSQFLPHVSILTVEKNAPSWSRAALDNMKRRFALRALGRIGNTATSPDDVTDPATLALIKSELGLVPTEFGTTKLWVYAPDGNPTAGFGGIKDLTNLGGREPTLFEVLKAAIPAASLGGAPTPAATAPAVALANPVFNTYTASGSYTAQQKKQDAHIFQIGANMIDQYDTNSYPTDITVLMEGTEPRNPANRFFGIENLPYLSRVRAVFHAEKRAANPTAGTPAGVFLKAWLLPELVNPNATALNGANVKVRIRVTGSASVFVDDNTGNTRREGVTFTNTSSPAIPQHTIWHNGSVAAATGELELTAAQLGTTASVWAPVAAAGSTERGFFAMAAETAVDIDPAGTKPDYTYSIESGNAGGTDPLTFILEYGLADPANPSNTIWRPYSIWNEIKAGTDSRLSSVAPNTGELDTRVSNSALTAAPVWTKEDPRTERSIVLMNASGNVTTTPIVANAFRLDEAFRGVGDLTAVFRDIPQENLLTAETGNTFAGVLDFFSIDANEYAYGKIALNSRSRETLKAMLDGTVSSAFGAASSPSYLNATSAKALAEAFTDFNIGTASQGGVTPPIKNRVELASWANAQSAGGFTSSPGKETTLRALGEVGNARTWNLMIDVIAQSGRIPPTTADNKASTAFIVEGERRYWIHVAIDRYTGEEISSRIVEMVKE